MADLATYASAYINDLTTHTEDLSAPFRWLLSPRSSHLGAFFSATCPVNCKFFSGLRRVVYAEVHILLIMSC